MRSLVIVIMKPLIQILLEFFDGTIEFLAEGFPEKFIQDSAVESFHKTIGTGIAHLGPSVCDFVEFQKNLVRMDHWPTTIFPTVVCQDMFHIKALLPVEGEHLVIKDIHSGLREFGGVEFPEGKGAKGIYHGLKVDPANALEGAHKKGVLAQEISCVGALYLAFTEAWIGFLQKLDLFLGEFYVLAVFLLLKAKETFIAGLHVFLKPDVADRAGAHCDTFQTEMITDVERSPGRMLQRQPDKLLLYLRGCLIGERVRNRRLVNEAFETPLLESPLVFIELASGYPVMPTGL
jgi:hypothetical protein